MWDTVVERARAKELYELQLTDVEDIIEVTFRSRKVPTAHWKTSLMGKSVWLY